MLYYSYTHQTEKVMETMAEVLRDRGCQTTLAAIEFSDPRYEKRFKQFPMPRPFLEVVAMIPAELGHERRTRSGTGRRDRRELRLRGHRSTHLVAVHRRSHS